MAQRNERHMTKTQLKALRLKLAPGQQPVDRYWSSVAKVFRDLYDADQAVPMREYRAPTEAQIKALEHGRWIAATVECKGCKNRVYPYELGNKGASRFCSPCHGMHIKKEASKCAKRWLELDPLFIDLETTGLSHEAEVIEIAILDKSGLVVFETLVKPSSPIPNEATSVNGITNRMVESSPSFAQVVDQVGSIIQGRSIIAHNSHFDFSMLYREFRRCDKKDLFPTDSWHCTMRLLCDQNEGRYPSLDLAMHLSGAEHPSEGEFHRARYDADCCRLVVLKLAHQDTVSSPCSTSPSISVSGDG